MTTSNAQRTAPPRPKTRQVAVRNLQVGDKIVLPYIAHGCERQAVCVITALKDVSERGYNGRVEISFRRDALDGAASTKPPKTWKEYHGRDDLLDAQVEPSSSTDD